MFAAPRLLKSTALLNVTMISARSLGERLTVGRRRREDLQAIDQAHRLHGVDQAESALDVPSAGGRPLRGRAEAINAFRISVGVAVGFICFMSAAMAAAFGAADEVPKKLGRFCERFDGVVGCPGRPGLVVLITLPKNEVLPPSGAEMSGF